MKIVAERLFLVKAAFTA